MCTLQSVAIESSNEGYNGCIFSHEDSVATSAEEEQYVQNKESLTS